MSKLGQLLSYLERSDVRGLVFREGDPAALDTDTRTIPVTAQALTAKQIRRFFDDVEVPAGLHPRAGSHERSRVQVDGRTFHVVAHDEGGKLVVRVNNVTLTRTPTREVPTLTVGRARAETLQAVQAVTRRDDSGPVTVQRDDSGPVSTRRRHDTPPTAARLVPSLAANARSPSSPADFATSPTVRAHPVSRTSPSHAAADDAPGALLSLLVRARNERASDVHISSDAPPRIRHASLLEPVGTVIPHVRVQAMLRSLLSPRDAQQLASRGYTDFGVELEGAGRLRVNACRHQGGLKLCFRLVSPEPPDLEALGLPPEVRKLLDQHQGLVVISGPSGHGKTTTLAALVDMWNASRAVHIITVEDPVEVLHPRKHAVVTQREVGTHTRSFPSALAAALREDPDVIVIGELRDRETVEMALSAAETGHLVLATMSTPSAGKTIDRLIDMFPPDDQSQVRATLAGALKLVLSQRLLRRADGSGLVAAYEMVTGNVPLWSLVRDNKLFQLPSLFQRGRNFGMIRLEDSLRELLAAGIVEAEEAERYASDARALKPRSTTGGAAAVNAAALGRHGGS